MPEDTLAPLQFTPEPDVIPDDLILYKYRDWERECHRILLIDGSLYLARPAEFNDPFDCAISCQIDPNMPKDERIDCFKRIYRHDNSGIDERQLAIKAEMISKNFNWNDLLHKAHLDDLRTPSAIVSLSAVNDSILMWSHYAKDHRGFCIGYKSKALLNYIKAVSDYLLNTMEGFTDSKARASFMKNELSDKAIIGGIYKVKYDEKMPVRDFRDFTNCYISRTINCLPFIYKYKDWAYEQEWRIVGQRGDQGQTNNPLTITVPPSCINRVILGCQISQKHEDEIRAVLNRENFKHVKLFKAQQQPFSFKLSINQVAK